MRGIANFRFSLKAAGFEGLLGAKSEHNNSGHQVFHLLLQARAYLRVDADKVN
jgi:hypothetical protein